MQSSGSIKKLWILGWLACVVGVSLWMMKSGGSRDGGRLPEASDPSEDSDIRYRPDRSPRHREEGVSVAKTISTQEEFMDLTDADWLDNDRRQVLVADLVRWAQDHGKVAVEYLSRVPLAVRDEVACALAGSMLLEQSELAWQILVDLPASPLSQSLIQQLAMEYVEKSPEEALDWALGLEAPEQEDAARDREAVIAAVLTAYSGKDPVKAMDLATNQLATSDRLAKTTVEIVQRWTQSDPVAAAAHVLEMSQGKVRDAALENLVRIWSAAQPDDARKWVKGLSDPGMKAAAESYLPVAEASDSR